MDHAFVRGLLARGLDVVTVAEAGRLGLPDEEQLAFAAGQGRAIYTCNVADFTRLHARWLRADRHHAGIIILSDQLTPIGGQIRALMRLTREFEPDAMRDRLEFLSNWVN